MKVLFVSAILPYPLVSGGQVRLYNLLKRVSLEHEVTLLTFIRSENERTLAEKLPFVKKTVMVMRGRALRLDYLLKAFFGKYPWLLATYDNRMMRKAITAELAKGDYDLVHIEPFYVYPSVPATKKPLVVSEHNIEYDVYASYVKRFPVGPLQPLLASDVRKLKTWEETVWRKAAHVTAVSEDDASRIREDIPADRVTVVPNGVDTDSFVVATKKPDRSSPVFLFVGNFAWLPNRDALTLLVSSIWPAIRAKLPNATLRVVGRGMPAPLAAKSAIPGVSVVGEVGDIRDEFQSCDALLAPMKIAGGTKFKLIEALASGVPVITTPEGAAGLSEKAVAALAVAESDDAFVTAAVSVFDEQNAWKERTAMGRAAVEREYGWKGIAKKLSDVWKGAA